MGNSILKGISAALLVTVLTLLAGMLWTSLELGGLSMSTLVDIGLIASCVAAGYRAGKESGQWILGGVASLGYVALCIILMALFLEVSSWGIIQVLAEGGLIGILSGALGAAGTSTKRGPVRSWAAPRRSSTWESSNYQNDSRQAPYQEWDSHVNDWDDLEDYEWERSDKKKSEGKKSWFSSEKANSRKGNSSRDDELYELPDHKDYQNSYIDHKEHKSPKNHTDRKDHKHHKDHYKDDYGAGYNDNNVDYHERDDEDQWENWIQEDKKNPSPPARSSIAAQHKAWWEEDVL
jgi:putative membrane protein (TIGR04086 family)